MRKSLDWGPFAGNQPLFSGFISLHNLTSRVDAPKKAQTCYLPLKWSSQKVTQVQELSKSMSQLPPGVASREPSDPFFACPPPHQTRTMERNAKPEAVPMLASLGAIDQTHATIVSSLKKFRLLGKTQLLCEGKPQNHSRKVIVWESHNYSVAAQKTQNQWSSLFGPWLKWQHGKSKRSFQVAKNKSLSCSKLRGNMTPFLRGHGDSRCLFFIPGRFAPCRLSWDTLTEDASFPHSGEGSLPAIGPRTAQTCCVLKWLWVKNRHPKWNAGTWKHGPKPAVPWWFNFDPYPNGPTPPPKNSIQSEAELE